MNFAAHGHTAAEVIVEREYNIFKDGVKNLPSEVELHYLESIGELKQIGDKRN